MAQEIDRITMEKVHGLLDDLVDMGEHLLANAIHSQFRAGSHGRLYAEVAFDRSPGSPVHDDLALWADECCMREGEAKASDLYASFSRWKKARGENALSMTSWGSRLALVPGVTRRHTKAGNVYAGLRLRAEEATRLHAGAFADAKTGEPA